MNFLIHSAIALAVAFAVTYIMVPVSKRIAMRLGAIDYPGNRRVNRTPIPRCGGIAIFVGFMATFLLVSLLARTYGNCILDFVMERDVNGFLLVGGIALMFVVGLVDDVRQLGPKVKFLWQIASCAIVFASGISFDVVANPFDGSLIPLGVLDGPLTVLYLLVFVNVTNLIDGLDGLAAGLVAIVAACLLALVIPSGSFTVSAMCLGLIGACLAFLRYNFYPATVFMGDSGSLFLGLIVGIISIMGVARTASLVLMLVPLVIAGVPVIDTASAVVRRILAHKHIDEADMGHVHHRLLNLGYSQRKAVLILYTCSAALGVAGVSVGYIDGPGRFAVLGAMAAIVAIAIWKLGLFRPVLQHYYDNRGQTGPRIPKGYEPGSQIPKTSPRADPPKGESDGEPADSPEPGSPPRDAV